MERERTLEGLLHAVRTGTMNRRSLLKRATVLGLSAPAISVLLAACETDDDTDDAVAEETDDTADPEPADEPEEEDDEEVEVEDPDDGDEPVDDVEEEDDVEDDDTVDDPDHDGEGQYGGTLRVATIGEPATLDIHQTTAGITAEVSFCWAEPLFSYDESYEPTPMLVEEYTVSDDATVHTFKLREGVMFHNGEEMTAEDAVASIERWGEISGVGGNIMEVTESLSITDDYEFEWVTSIPYGTILVALCSNTQACVIYPQEVIENAGLDPLTEYVGTGPYQFVEHTADVHILFERFEDYAALDGGINGYGGTKFAYVDQIEFIPVPDESSRVNGMQAGDYHLVMDLSNDQYDVLAEDENLRVTILPPSNWDVFFLNWRSPLMENLEIRQAFQACLDHMPIMQASRGGGDFVALDPSFMMEPTPWHSMVGEDLYNMADPERAAELLEEGGYDGTPVRFIATQEYSYMYNAAVIAVQQMEDAGFEVDFQLYDWSTILEMRADPDAWDIFVTGHGFVPDPSQVTFIGQINVYPGWWSDEEALDLVDQFLSESDFDTRYELWEQLQQRAYDTVPAVKTGDSSVISVWSRQVGGFTEQLQRGIPYWNVWLEEQA
jgi:peptide/nickel transport system substrate-binding protein